MNNKMRLVKTMIIRLCLALILIFGVAAAGVFAGQPTEDVKAIINETMGILQNPAYQAAAQKPARILLIQQLALRRIDYGEMAKRSLYQTWNTLTQAQRAEFVRLFTELLRASYADKLDDFGKAKVTYEGETQKGDAAEVRIMVWRPNDKIPVKFLLRNGPKGWMIQDLIIEDVSLVDNFRTEFGRIIKTSSFTALVKCMQLKLQASIPDLKACPVPQEPAPKARSKGGG